MEHSHSEHSHHIHHHPKVENRFNLAISATLHCLLGCGLGEVLGIIIGTALYLDNITTMALGIILGFVMGFALGIMPLLRAKFTFQKALKAVLVAEGLSIVVMEATEVLVQVYTPGVMEAMLTDSIFWWGMLLSLFAGFIVALPVNYYLIGLGIRHQH
jgi:hypothetical protein